MLGCGAFGEVLKATNLKSDIECAVKIYQKSRIESNPNSETMKELLMDELTCLQ